ncbi:MAG: hypothetical protein HONBIEJF_00901 [Fimbriimonadaceae bacterium]|nr:hypothetical protein [Fimbriimonadaceae bacterium]
MSKLQDRYTITNSEEPVARFLETVARFLFFGGLLAALVGIGFVLYNYNVFAGIGMQPDNKRALANLDSFSTLAMAGSAACALGACFLFWEEEILGALLFMGAAALYLSSLYVPSIFGSSQTNAVTERAFEILRNCGLVLGTIALIVIVIDLIRRVRERVQEGSKADQLKYGKGVKQEKEIHNIFMGKCWQLPFCRKFVREKCPIYHARRTCWKERVGCMCEESVIQNAMSGKVIPADLVAAAKYIPRNNKLTEEMKKERCRVCVIYNEHQKHKYKLALPLVILSLVAVYAVGRTSLLAWLSGAIGAVDKVLSTATYSEKGGSLQQQAQNSVLPFHEILLVCLLVIIFAYLMRFLEYLFFKAKV